VGGTKKRKKNLTLTMGQREGTLKQPEVRVLKIG